MMEKPHSTNCEIFCGFFFFCLKKYILYVYNDTVENVVEIRLRHDKILKQRELNVSSCARIDHKTLICLL